VRYQSDGIVPGSSPGPYGKTAHVQLLYRMPLREMIKKENESIPISQAEEMQPGLGCIMALGGILSAAFLITLRRRG